MTPKSMIKIRGAVSLAVLVLFIILVATGFLMYFGDGTRGLKLHTTAGFLIAFFVVLHLAMTYKMLIVELKALFGRT